MLFFLCATLAAADPGHRPEPGDDVHVSRRPLRPDDHRLWRKGEALVAVADGVVVRGAPELDAAAVATLSAGALVILREAPGVHPVDDPDRDDRWLTVRAGDTEGWVRQAGISQAGWDVDLDGDGVPEPVTVGFNAGGEVVVRVRGEGGTQAVNLGTRQDIAGIQDDAQATLLPTSVAGVALVRVVWSAREQCGSGDYVAYASFVRPTAGGSPVLQEALRHSGSGGDAPIWWETDVTFDAEGGTAVVHQRNGESLDDGTENIHHEAWKRYRLADGVFREVPAPGP